MRGKVGKGRGRTGRGKNEAVKAEDLDRDLGLCKLFLQPLFLLF